MGRLTKTESLRRHAKRRAEQRFGLSLNREDLDALVAQIQAQPARAKFLERQSLTRTVWQVDLRGQPAIAIYDKKRQTIITLMPIEWLRQYQPTVNP